MQSPWKPLLTTFARDPCEPSFLCTQTFSGVEFQRGSPASQPTPHRCRKLRRPPGPEDLAVRGQRNPSRQNTLPVWVPPLDWPPTCFGHDGNKDHSWTTESLPTKHPAGRCSTAGMASDMVGPRWKRRSFVDDGIPPNKIPCRSGFHRWIGLRHGWARMETKIIRGRWNPPYFFIISTSNSRSTRGPW